MLKGTFAATLIVMCAQVCADEVAVPTYATHQDGRRIVDAVRTPQPMPGTASEIIARAHSCAARYASSSGSQQGIEMVDPANGVLVANINSDYTGFLGAGGRARAKMMIEAKEGRFRISLSEIQREQGHNFDILVRAPGTGADKVIQALEAVSEKIAACLTTAKSDDW
jgi:hypothetical protein